MGQKDLLYPWLSVRDNVALGARLRGEKVDRARVTALLEQVELSSCADARPATLSGGMRQRAALARCLIRQRPILLLDEPFSALDPALRNEMLQLLQTVCEQRNLTLLMVSHNLDDAARIAPRTLLVVDGRIYYDGPTQALLDGSAPEARVLGISGKA
ncbi:ATP-binding cassette domain-containing protein [Escherichia coli]|nr:ATP-binding cassette domain-containing protein [Escherichia coli]